MIKDIQYISLREDCNCKIQFVRKDGTLLDLSSLSTKAYAIIKDAAGNPIIKFAKAQTVGWEGIDNTLMSTGIYQFIIPSSITQSLKPGNKECFTKTLRRSAFA